jgi:hypothetical protein
MDLGTAGCTLLEQLKLSIETQRQLLDMLAAPVEGQEKMTF